MTGKTILLLSAAAAGVLALFIAVRIYDPVHEIPVSLKIKFFDFRTITRSRTLPDYFNDDDTIVRTVLELLKKTEAGSVKLRLLGVTVSGFYGEQSSGEMYQPEFEFMADLPFRRW